MSKPSKYINASDIGKCAFCPSSLFHSRHKVEQSKDAQVRTYLGISSHDSLNLAVQNEAKQYNLLHRFVRFLLKLLGVTKQ